MDLTTAHLEKSKVSKRKRGPTKMKNIAMDGDDKIEVKFNENGQPIEEGSTTLSSFLGSLVREIVPYTISDWRKVPLKMKNILWNCVQLRYKLDNEWQKAYILNEMGGL
ncbi:hypothetical protein AB3S75_034887 [Citrus x aurantiifolia]